jgi:uncharacterized membrane protein YhaH (DUF805 family)
MQIYWSVMSGLLLLPWSLIFAPALTLGYRRLTSGAGRRDRRMHWVWIFLVLFAVLAGATVAFAAEPAATPLQRLHDGVQDLATGWTRMFQVIAVETVERGPISGLLVGGIEGSHQALRQTTRGAYETATFLLAVPRPQPTPSEPGQILEVRF